MVIYLVWDLETASGTIRRFLSFPTYHLEPKYHELSQIAMNMTGRRVYLSLSVGHICSKVGSDIGFHVMKYKISARFHLVLSAL